LPAARPAAHSNGIISHGKYHHRPRVCVRRPCRIHLLTGCEDRSVVTGRAFRAEHGRRAVARPKRAGATGPAPAGADQRSRFECSRRYRGVQLTWCTCRAGRGRERERLPVVFTSHGGRGGPQPARRGVLADGTGDGGPAPVRRFVVPGILGGHAPAPGVAERGLGPGETQEGVMGAGAAEKGRRSDVGLHARRARRSRAGRYPPSTAGTASTRPGNPNGDGWPTASPPTRPTPPPFEARRFGRPDFRVGAVGRRSRSSHPKPRRFRRDGVHRRRRSRERSTNGGGSVRPFPGHCDFQKNQFASVRRASTRWVGPQRLPAAAPKDGATVAPGPRPVSGGPKAEDRDAHSTYAPCKRVPRRVVLWKLPRRRHVWPGRLSKPSAGTPARGVLGEENYEHRRRHTEVGLWSASRSNPLPKT